MSKLLSILCVTQAQPFAEPFLRDLAEFSQLINAQLVVAVDAREKQTQRLVLPECPKIVLTLKSHGYIESVLDNAVSVCSGQYVLRIDDDEMCSPAMKQWIQTEQYRIADNWQFPRVHLWRTSHGLGALMTPHLWPDFQTRLSVHAKAGSRCGVHQGSPFGGGEEAPVNLVHHKFVVRTREERAVIAARYDAYSPGYGTGNMKPFSLPEESYDLVNIVDPGEGHIKWTPAWTETVMLRGDTL